MGLLNRSRSWNAKDLFEEEEEEDDGQSVVEDCSREAVCKQLHLVCAFIVDSQFYCDI